MKVPNAPVPAPAGPTHPFEPFSGEFESGTDKITIKETCPLNSNFRESRNIMRRDRKNFENFDFFTTF